MKKTYLSLSFLIFLTQFLYSQVEFEENIIIDKSFGLEYPKDIVSGDLDGDGHEDIITVGNRGVWMKNEDGNGNFSNLITFTVDAVNPSNLGVADFDNDGDLDIVFSDVGTQEGVFICENIDGLGNFSAPFQIHDSRMGEFHQLIDMDNDGDIDIVHGGPNSGFDWLENMNEEFIFERRGYVSGYTDGFYAFDVNNDGLMDVIQDSGYDLKLYTLNPDGSTNFEGVMYDFALLHDYKSADIDNDGDQDFFTLFKNGNSNQIHWYENQDGLGSFSSRKILMDLPNTGYGRVGEIILVDLDNDGLTDIVKDQIELNSIHWYKNLGNNTFSDLIVINDMIPETQRIHLTDIDNDGDQDIFFSTRDTRDVMWLEHLDGNGNFEDPIRITSFVNGFVETVHADIDGDGDLDLVSSSAVNNRVAWYENTDGQGNFSSQQQIISAYTEEAASILVFDIDGDSDMDVFAKTFLDNSTNETKLLWFENDGSGNFSGEQIFYTNEEGINHIQTIDIDTDNDEDIYAVIYPNTHLIFKNNGGIFEEPYELITPVGGSFSARTSLFKDMDQDGDQDLLIAHDVYNDDNDLIVWYENSDGQGDFSSTHVVGEINGNIHTILSGDLNNDNTIDVVYGKYSGGNNIGHFLGQNAQGTSFDEIVVLDAEWPQLGVRMHLLDIDHDGDQDIITSSQENIDRLIWYPNDGSANFGSIVNISSFIGLISDIESADLNEDGKIDLIVATVNDNTIAWYKNLGVFSNSISGVVRLDANANGCDNADQGIPNILVTSNNGANTFSTFTSADGTYNLQANQENFNVTIAEEQLPDFYNSNPTSQEVDFTNLENTNLEANFCAQATESRNDVTISIFGPQDEPRPGFDTAYQIVYNNKGTTTLSGTITLEFDSEKIQFLNASESTSSETTNTISFDYTDLNPFETRTIDVEFNVFPPPTTNIDDVLVFSATIDPMSSDETEEDNSFSLQQIVIGSYDPNDIQVLEGPQILIDDIDQYLHYIIRFQNTGTASAINVNVEHNLDEKLDWSSMKLQSLSHEGVVEITDGNRINFKFDNIHLPDSTSNEPESHGHIAFKIKPRNDVEVGDVFSGVADIFFDFNPPITTNTTTTQIVTTLSTTDEFLNKFSIYPNPSDDTINISGSEILDSFVIYDIHGRELMRKEFLNPDLSQEIDIGSLTAGIYFLQVQSGIHRKTQKFIKK